MIAVKAVETSVTRNRLTQDNNSQDDQFTISHNVSHFFSGVFDRLNILQHLAIIFNIIDKKFLISVRQKSTKVRLGIPSQKNATTRPFMFVEVDRPG